MIININVPEKKNHKQAQFNYLTAHTHSRLFTACIQSLVAPFQALKHFCLICWMLMFYMLNQFVGLVCLMPAQWVKRIWRLGQAKSILKTL